MNCNKTLQMANDFLDKTLSKSEEQMIKRHLEECNSCRSEYQNLEKADNVLRQVICEMVADIVVPGGLSERIEMNLSAGSRKNTFWSRLSVVLKTPAAAAALLFVVLAAGFLTYNNYFNPVNQQKVAISESTDSAGVQAADKNGPAVDGKTDPLSGVQVLQAESDSTIKTDVQLDRDTGSAVKIPAENQPDSTVGILSGQPPAPADAVPEALSKSSPEVNQRRASVTSVPPGMGGGMADSNSGSMEEAVRDAGFIPSQPSYLPPGAVLTDVSWYTGEISQYYRAGKYSFTISQCRLDAGDFEYTGEISQGSAVDINGMPGFIQVNRPEPGGGNVAGSSTTLRWRKGDWAFSVSGDLPADEIIKISTSIK